MPLRIDLNSYTVRNVDGCLIWTGRVGPDGYGRCGHKSAHRRVYEALVGPIPAGLELDHLCRTRLCVEPTHLEPVTHAENIRRRYRLQTHCVNGHEFNGVNTYMRPTGHRDCRECIRRRARKYKASKRVAA